MQNARDAKKRGILHPLGRVWVFGTVWLEPTWWFGVQWHCHKLINMQYFRIEVNEVHLAELWCLHSQSHCAREPAASKDWAQGSEKNGASVNRIRIKYANSIRPFYAIGCEWRNYPATGWKLNKQCRFFILKSSRHAQKEQWRTLWYENEFYESHLWEEFIAWKHLICTICGGRLKAQFLTDTVHPLFVKQWVF